MYVHFVTGLQRIGTASYSLHKRVMLVKAELRSESLAVTVRLGILIAVPVGQPRAPSAEDSHCRVVSRIRGVLLTPAP